MNSQELFNQNRYLKQLIQQRQLISEIINPFEFRYPMSFPLLSQQMESDSYKFVVPFTKRSGNTSDYYKASEPQFQAPTTSTVFPKFSLPFLDVESDAISTLKSDNSFKWPYKNTSQTDYEFKSTTGYDPDTLNITQLGNLGLMNLFTTQVRSGYEDDIQAVYDGIGIFPSRFKLTDSLKKRLTFREYERNGFRNYNRIM